jgi:hypothetical protein
MSDNAKGEPESLIIHTPAEDIHRTLEPRQLAHREKMIMQQFNNSEVEIVWEHGTLQIPLLGHEPFYPNGAISNIYMCELKTLNN